MPTHTRIVVLALLVTVAAVLTLVLVQPVRAGTPVTLNTKLYYSPSIAVGGRDQDTATLSGFYASIATGTVTYEYWNGTSSCSGNTHTSLAVTVSNGNVPNSPWVTFTTAGSYSWNASYSGDSNNNPATSSCQPLTANQATTTVTTGTGRTTILTGTLAGDIAGVWGGYLTTGTVTYELWNATSTCSGSIHRTFPPVTVNNAGNAPASPSVKFTTAGSYGWNASYSGDVNNPPAASSCEPLTVINSKLSPSLSTAVNSTKVPIGTYVYDNATLTGASSDATGTITYEIWNTTSCSGSWYRTFTFNIFNDVVPVSQYYYATWLGPMSWNASYSGDAVNNPATSACEPFTVIKASPKMSTLLLYRPTIQIGFSETDHAFLSPVYHGTGTVIYYVWNGTSACSGKRYSTDFAQVYTDLFGNTFVQDDRPISITTPPGSQWSWNASYLGDANNNPAKSACESVTVVRAYIFMQTLAGGTIPVGSQAGAGATFTGGGYYPTGIVTYYLWNASDTCGNGIVNPSNSWNVTVTSNYLIPNSPAVTFTTIGQYSWEASYMGDTNNMPAYGYCRALYVVKTSPVVTTTLSSPSIAVRHLASDSASLSATYRPTGTLVYAIYNQTATCSGLPSRSITVPLTSGVPSGSGQLNFTTAGYYSWTATYNGDVNNNPATSACELLTVTKMTPVITTALSSTTIIAGNSVFDQASLSGATIDVTGIVGYSFWTSISCTGTVTSVSNVTMTSGTVPNSAPRTFLAGSYGWTASYRGDANNNSVTSACEPVTVNKTTPTITTALSMTTITAGSSVTDSASLTGSFLASGTVVYNEFSGSTCTGAAMVVSTVTVIVGTVPSSIPITPIPAGSYSFHAAYSGDSNNNPATSPCEPLTVNKASPTIATSLSASAVSRGSSVFDHATISGGAFISGTVTYVYWASAICTGPSVNVSTATVVSGTVPDSAPMTLPVGLYGWTASYSGDPNNDPAVSQCEPLTVNPLTLGINSITVEGSPTSVTIGQTITFDVTVYNNGTTDQTFTLAVFWGSVQVAQKNFTLAHGQNQTLTLSWNTGTATAGTNTVLAQIVKGPPSTSTNATRGQSLTLSPPNQSSTSILQTILFAAGIGAALAILVSVFILRRRRKST